MATEKPSTAITASENEVELQARFRKELTNIHALHRLARRARVALSCLDSTYQDPKMFKAGLHALHNLHIAVREFPMWLEFDLAFARSELSDDSTHGRVTGKAIRTWNMIQLGCLEPAATTTPSCCLKDTLMLQMDGYADNQPRFVEWSVQVWKTVSEYLVRNPFYENWDDVRRALGWELDLALTDLQERYIGRSGGVAVPNVELLIFRKEQESPTATEEKPPQQSTEQASSDPATSEDAAEETSFSYVAIENKGTCPPGKQVSDREARDAWIYEKCCQNVVHKKIVSELDRLAANKNWVKISTIQGIRAAAKRFAERHKLPPPPPRHEV